MKKILTVMLVMAGFNTMAQTKQTTKDTVKVNNPQQQQQVVTYNIVLTEQALHILITALDQSDYSYREVSLLRAYIAEQLKKQKQIEK